MAMLRLLLVMVIGIGIALPAIYPAAAAQGSSKDQSRLGEDSEESRSPIPDDAETTPADQFGLEDMQSIETVELSLEQARRSLDAFVLVRDKYENTTIYEYETLEEFVEKTSDGKRLEADVKSFGFASVGEWNKVITTVSLAYSAVADDPKGDMAQQIADIEADPSLAADVKLRMVNSLRSMIPSENNKKVMAELIKDQSYADKLRLLAEEE
jgi:hypothetical protein